MLTDAIARGRGAVREQMQPWWLGKRGKPRIDPAQLADAVVEDWTASKLEVLTAPTPRKRASESWADYQARATERRADIQAAQEWMRESGVDRPDAARAMERLIAKRGWRLDTKRQRRAKFLERWPAITGVGAE